MRRQVCHEQEDAIEVYHEQEVVVVVVVGVVASGRQWLRQIKPCWAIVHFAQTSTPMRCDGVVRCAAAVCAQTLRMPSIFACLQKLLHNAADLAQRAPPVESVAPSVQTVNRGGGRDGGVGWDGVARPQR